MWDAKLAERRRGAGDGPRETLVDRLEPEVAKAYDQVAGAGRRRRHGLRTRRGARRARGRRWPRHAADDLRRGVTSVGPHRDELALSPSAGCRRAPTRPRASSGRWRWPCGWRPTRVVAEASGTAPVLLLDDVFSELDPDRSEALLAHLPAVRPS